MGHDGPGRHRHGAASGALLPLLLLGALAPSPIEAQAPAGEPRVVDVRFEARIGARSADGREESRIRVVYRLLPTPDADTVPIKGLAFFGNRPEGLEAAFGGGEPRTVALANPRGDLLQARLPLPRTRGPGDTLSLALAYVLDRAIPADARDFDLVLPVLYADWRPLGAPEDMFVASVTIPSEYSVVETFPTVPKEVSGGEEGRTYGFRVQVVPSMVRFRGHVGEPPLFTFARRVDLAVVMLLLVAGAFGWWGLTRETT